LEKFTFKSLLTTLTMLLVVCVSAQAQKAAAQDINRCGTMEYYNRMIQADPTLPARWKAEGDRKYAEYLQRNAGSRPTNTNAVVIIPVAVHVIGTAANQAFATDDMIQRQIDVLNRDFAGLNPDSTKIPAAFKPLFAHSNIRFALARRTPGGVATNGIDRRVSAMTVTAGTVNNLKTFAAGGLDQWDGTKYLNVWMGNFSDGTLGIATFPNTGAANLQGVAIHTGSIDQPCGSAFPGLYDKGRTLTHEVGHYLYLFHIWGDDGTACSGNDWGTPYGSLPAACTDDTPNQGGPTFGCPTGVLTDACANTAPGFQYQNYMDYTDDACLVMFTKNQACRAEGCIDVHRAGLKTSDALTPVGAPVTDARVSEVLNPTSIGFACASNTNYCNPFAPQVLIVNDGDTPLSSVIIDSKVDGVVANTLNYTFATPLVPGGAEYVTLGTVNSTSGAHVLTVKTRSPNGGTDGRPNNDSLNARFNQSGGAGIGLPISDGFESTTFPSAGYSLSNPDNGVTWARSTLAAKTGVASMRINAYNYNSRGAIDMFLTPKVNTSTADIVRVKFDVAYARYSAADIDQLEVVYSTDCGLTYLPTGYVKNQTALATNGGAFVTGSFTPTAAQWRTDSVDINIGCGTPIPSMIIGLKWVNQYGNNCYIDNFSVTAVAGTSLDAKATSLSPIASPICPGASGQGTISPSFTFSNQGTTTLTNVGLNYRIDNGPVQALPAWTGSLAKCGSASVQLPNINVGGGNHVLKVFTSNPNGSADLVPGNDTAFASFYVQEVLAIPSTQSFEATTFPPANGWGLQNPDGGITWVRSTAAAKTGAASMFMDGYNYTTVGALDMLTTPSIALGGLDTLNMSFQVAYAQYSATGSDSLEVLYSTNCGVTWQSAGYKKGGSQLKTTTAQFVTAAFVPTASEWRKENLTISTCNFTAPSIMFGFRFINGYGNNCYIDDIAFTSAASRTYNSAALSIASPAGTVCGANDATFTPKVTIGNFGAGPLTSVVINYKVDNNTVSTFNWTGNLARCATTEVTLNPVTAPKGTHTFTVYTTLPNANADQFTGNDTTFTSFVVSPTVATPVVEGFENTTFPGTDFGIQNPDNQTTFTRATGNARTGTGAMVMRNFSYTPGSGTTVDRFISPVVTNNANIDSVFVSFDYSYMQGAQYPGSTVRPLDTLELMVTTDCGATFKTIWKQWGEDLQTITDPNYSATVAFTPTSAGAWRNVRIYLNPFVGNSNFQVYWVNKGNRQNDLWLDNINITSKTLPARLRNQGYLIYPNPFENVFRIHHWVAPQDLKAAQIFNAAGQLVWDKRYSGNADTEIFVDMSKLAKGTYTLKMTYSNKVVVERIVKLK